MSSWKQSYAKALEHRASYLRQVGHDEIADTLMDKARQWQPKISNNTLREKIEISIPESPIWQNNTDELHDRILAKRALIPPAQQEDFSERVDAIDPNLHTEDWFELREEILDRVWRSWKATLQGKELVSRPHFESAQGPYNNRTVLEDLLENVAQVDPIWVADFTELYQRMHFWEKSLKS